MPLEQGHEYFKETIGDCPFDNVCVTTDGVEQCFCGSNTNSTVDMNARRKKMPDNLEDPRGEVVKMPHSDEGFPGRMITRIFVKFLEKYFE